MMKYLLVVSMMLSMPSWAGCYTLDDCFDVKKNDYTIVVEGYMVRAFGVSVVTDEAWEIVLIKQKDSGFVRGINENDEVHWEDRIDIDYDPDEKINPLTFSKVITRECKGGLCKTALE